MMYLSYALTASAISCLTMSTVTAHKLESSTANFKVENPRRAGLLQHELHVNHVEPPVELVADLFEVSDLFKPEPGMEPDADGVLGINQPNDRVKLAVARRFNERSEQL